MADAPNLIDESWGQALPCAVKVAGVEIVSLYLGPSTNGKNATAARIRAYHQSGVGVQLNFEWYQGRALEGATAGKADAQLAVAQIRQLEAELGYSPQSVLMVPFSVDFDATPAQFPAIDAYLTAAAEVMHAAGFHVGDYGSFAVVEHTSKQKITDAEWQTYAWSGGKLSPAADVYQFLNGQKLGGAEVDFDRIIHADQLGAWWPPQSAGDLAGATLEGGSDMSLSRHDLDQIAGAVWSHKIKVDGRPTRRADFALAHAWDGAGKATGALAKLVPVVDGLKTLLADEQAGVLQRVASVQTKLDKLAAAVAKIPNSPTQIAVDVAALADAVAARVKSLVWKAA